MEDRTDRRSELDYDDDYHENDDQPAPGPHHSIPGRPGCLTLTQIPTPAVRRNTPTAYPPAVPRTMRDAA
jgi:hypothetical protein